MKLINDERIKIFKDYFEYFLFYAFCGWIYESFWCSIVVHKYGFVNRGFLFGPYLPIYGFGFLIILLIFNKFKIKKLIPTFIFGTIIATLAELIGSYIMEFFTGSFLWDYKDEFLNFEGRIALKPDLIFGFLICVGIGLIQPKLVKYQEKYEDSKLRNILFIIIFILFVIDILLKFIFGSNFTGTP